MSQGSQGGIERAGIQRDAGCFGRRAGVVGGWLAGLGVREPGLRGASQAGFRLVWWLAGLLWIAELGGGPVAGGGLGG